MLVEVLYLEGCPNHEATLELVGRVADESGLHPEIRQVEVADPETAAQLRFLGSPTVRVDGRDIEPGAAERDQFVLACRVFRTDAGFSGQPDEHWLRASLTTKSAGVHVDDDHDGDHEH